MSDYGLYGIDEILALSIVNVYGSFAAAAASSVTYRYAETDKVIDAYEK